jgi:hypothetical protein
MIRRGCSFLIRVEIVDGHMRSETVKHGPIISVTLDKKCGIFNPLANAVNKVLIIFQYAPSVLSVVHALVSPRIDDEKQHPAQDRRFKHVLLYQPRDCQGG